MVLIKRLTVPLCDLSLYDEDIISEEIKTEIKMMKARQKKRERDDREVNTRSKREKREKVQKIDYKEENESEKEEEKDNSFKENEEENETEEEEENSYKKNQENRLSEYEKMVQKNREEKMAFLQSLRINEVKEEFESSVKSILPKPKLKVKQFKTIKKHKDAPVEPLRKSKRLANLDIDLSEDAILKRSLAEGASASQREINNNKLKLKKKPPKKIEFSKFSDIPFSQDVKDRPSSYPSKYPFEEAISVKDDITEFFLNFDFSVGDDVKFNSNHEANFKNMKMGESSVAKVVPTRITCLTVHPAVDNIMVIAGSKYGHLGFWNVTSNLHPILFLPHTQGVTNVKFNPYNTQQLISSSYDGTLRCGDMGTKSFNEIYNISGETSCTYFDFVSASTLLVSQRNGNVSVIDMRNGSLNSEKKHECHEYSVKTVHVHPGNKNLFLTADNKGNMKLWDLRKLQKKAIIDVNHHRRTISSAFFSPATGKHILTTSADDSLCIFDSSNLEKEILFKKSIKHNNFTGRWLTVFKATWLPNSDELFSVGSMDYPRKIEILNTNGNKVYNFSDEDYFTSITSVNEFHPSLNVLAGGNSSGKVFIYTDKKLSF